MDDLLCGLDRLRGVGTSDAKVCMGGGGAVSTRVRACPTRLRTAGSDVHLCPTVCLPVRHLAVRLPVSLFMCTHLPLLLFPQSCPPSTISLANHDCNPATSCGCGPRRPEQVGMRHRRVVQQLLHSLGRLGRLACDTLTPEDCVGAAAAVLNHVCGQLVAAVLAKG